MYILSVVWSQVRDFSLRGTTEVDCDLWIVELIIDLLNLKSGLEISFN